MSECVVCVRVKLRTKAAHVLLRCPLYSTFRDHLFNIACTFNGIFLSFNYNQKLVFLFSYFNMIRICAKTCNLILNERRNVLRQNSLRVSTLQYTRIYTAIFILSTKTMQFLHHVYSHLQIET